MELIRTIEIPQYIIKVQLSKERRAKYYKWNSKKKKWYPRQLPKTYNAKLQDKIYSTTKKGYLLDENGEKVLANPRSVGKPKYEKLSGNSFASGYGSPMIRAKLVRELKNFYMPFVKSIEPIDDVHFPIWIDWHLYTTVPTRLFDLSNFWFYYKYFEDCLFETEDENGNTISPVIPDDNIKFVTKPGTGPIFHPVENWEDRKFVFKIYADTREEIKTNNLWKPNQ